MCGKTKTHCHGAPCKRSHGSTESHILLYAQMTFIKYQSTRLQQEGSDRHRCAASIFAFQGTCNNSRLAHTAMDQTNTLSAQKNVNHKSAAVLTAWASCVAARQKLPEGIKQEIGPVWQPIQSRSEPRHRSPRVLAGAICSCECVLVCSRLRLVHCAMMFTCTFARSVREDKNTLPWSTGQAEPWVN